MNRQFTKKQWQYIAAFIIGVVGALFGGVWGGLAAAFAGDSWWPSESVLKSYRLALTCSGIFLGLAPAAMWLLCLRQLWVLPILSSAAASLSLIAFELISISNETRGKVFPAVVGFGFLAGLALWIIIRRSLTQETAPNKSIQAPPQ